jgi:hypothetical protein
MKILYALLALLMLQFLMICNASASSCGFRTQLKYQDGSTGCVQDLPFVNSPLIGDSRPLIDIANTVHNYVIARSKSQQCSAISIVVSDRPSSMASATPMAVLSNRALDLCMNQGCDCELIIGDGSVLIDKDALLLDPKANTNKAIAQDQDAKKQLAEKPAAKKDAIDEVVKPLQEKEINNKSLGAQSIGEEHIAALRKELEREIRASIQAETVSSQAAAISKAKVAPTIFANRKALVIGNDSYQSVTPLVNAREDAKVVAESLSSLGYKVSLKLDLTQKQFKSELRSFKSQVQSGDEVAIFYAGHGVQISSTNYLLPVDIAAQNEEEIRDDGVSLQRLLDDMSEKNAKFTLAMIDACRDNPFKGSGRALGTRGLAPTTAATGQMIVFSAGTGQQALDKLGPSDKSKNGVFTRVFVKEMQKPGVSVDRVVRNVRTEVVSLAKSVGHDQVPAIYDQVVGEFYFKQ